MISLNEIIKRQCASTSVSLDEWHRGLERGRQKDMAIVREARRKGSYGTDSEILGVHYKKEAKQRQQDAYRYVPPSEAGEAYNRSMANAAKE